MKCTACNQRNIDGKPLNMTTSRIFDIHLYLCDNCKALGLEPRHVIILSARKHGLDHVANWIIQHRYTGPAITAREIL